MAHNNPDFPQFADVLRMMADPSAPDCIGPAGTMSTSAPPAEAPTPAPVRAPSPVPRPAPAAPEPAAPPPARAQRHDGWTPERQVVFFDAVAEGLSTERACQVAGMSPSSAYAFKRRAAGQAFALGWRAAQQLGRDRIADKMMARAIDGYVETVTRPNGDVIERHRFDNRMAQAMLTRLDRQAEAVDAASLAANAAARAVAAEFDAFLALFDDPAPDAVNARAARFLALRAPAAGEQAPLAPAPDGLGIAATVDSLTRADRFARTGAALATEVDAADCDPADRAGWTLDQWRRADAAGLIEVAPDPEVSPLHPDDDADGVDDMPVWCETNSDRWWTSFPPPPGFDGCEHGRYGDYSYKRELSPEEQAAAAAEQAAHAARRERDEAARRDRWFAAAEDNAEAIHEELAAREEAEDDRAEDDRGYRVEEEQADDRPFILAPRDGSPSDGDDGAVMEFAPARPASAFSHDRDAREAGIAAAADPLHGPESESPHARQ